MTEPRPDGVPAPEVYEIPLTDDDIVKVPWSITDIGGAVWAASQHARADAHVSKIHEEASTLVEQYEAQVAAWVQAETAAAESTMRFMSSKLRPFYADRLRTQPGKSKTVKLPGGKLAESIGSVKAVVTDEAKLLAWLREFDPDCVRTPEPVVPQPAPDLNAIKARYQAKVDEQAGTYPAVVDPESVDEDDMRSAGDIVPGVQFERGAAKFTVEMEVEEGR